MTSFLENLSTRLLAWTLTEEALEGREMPALNAVEVNVAVCILTLIVCVDGLCGC